jgi:hypothetical protein
LIVTALKQAWWAPLAGVLLVIQLVLAVALVLGYEDAGDALLGVIVALVAAGALASGLWTRLQAHRVGSALIVVGAILNFYWFWALAPPALAIVVVVGVVVSEFRAPAPA